MLLHTRKTHEKLPWFLEPFYGNLLFEVPETPKDSDKAAVVWLVAYMRDKLSQDMTEEEALAAFSQLATITPPEAFEGFPKGVFDYTK